ncbi:MULTISPECIES: hypothetical protein [Caproicibacterium]|uniref:DUF3794 domain-containing protein n=1 Tax=Caproicibacterium argilliputei TaxID=3030016 RepID=A0AA97DCD4_9FIRM|nr:hypothetical protein [Caproicibacterium argilliputei]WOC33082.1 hypothetical protein PXC00_04165 [Caproicibacterium argilliputei]
MDEMNDTMRSGRFKEAVCIDAQRVYDSCSAKDCLEDLQVCFTQAKRPVIERAVSVRLRDVEVLTVYLNMEPVPFNKGFYSIDMTFVFDVSLDVYTAPASCPIVVDGIALFTKKAILYGSDGNVKVFTSDGSCDPTESGSGSRVTPKAVCQVAQPVGLSARICDTRPGCCPSFKIPDDICERFGGDFDFECSRSVYVTIGLFSIVQIVRNVQMLIPAYDFCVPTKECTPVSDNPCEMFKRIDFPTDSFFPPKVSDAGGCGCGCSQSQESAE